MEVEVTLTASGALQQRHQVIRPDSGGVCFQRFGERAAAASGTAHVVVGDLLDEQMVIGPGPSQRIEHVDEWCFTPRQA
jgi:hypothetical protein